MAQERFDEAAVAVALKKTMEENQSILEAFKADNSNVDQNLSATSTTGMGGQVGDAANNTFQNVNAVSFQNQQMLFKNFNDRVNEINKANFNMADTAKDFYKNTPVA